MADKKVTVTVELVNLAKEGLGLLKEGIHEVVEAVEGWIESSNAQEEANAQLDGALRATGVYSEELSQRYRDMASAFQEVSTAADEKIIPGMARLVSIGKVHSDQMEAATRAALDLAAGMRIDVDQAFSIVAKAAQGNVQWLQRNNIEVKASIDPTQQLANVVEILGEKFGGAAAAQTQTFSGRIGALAIQVDEVREALGDALKSAVLPFLTALQAQIPVLQSWMAENKPAIVREFAEAVAFLGQVMAVGLDVVSSAVDIYGYLRIKFAELLSILSPLLEYWAKLAEIATGGSNEMSDALRQVSAGLKENVKDQEEFQKKTDAASAAAHSAAEALREISSHVKEAAAGEAEMGPPMSAANKEMVAQAAAAKEAAAHVGELVGAAKKARDEFEAMENQAKYLPGQFEQLAEAMGSTGQAAIMMGDDVNKVIAYYQKLGKEVPESLREISRQAAELSHPFSFMGTRMDEIAKKAKEFGADLPKDFSSIRSAVDTTTLSLEQQEKMYESIRKAVDAIRDAQRKQAEEAQKEADAQHAADERAYFDKYKLVSITQDLTGEDDEKLNADDPRVKALRKQAQGVGGTGRYGTFGAAAAEALKEGNVSALEKIVNEARSMFETFRTSGALDAAGVLYNEQVGGKAVSDLQKILDQVKALQGVQGGPGDAGGYGAPTGLGGFGARPTGQPGRASEASTLASFAAQTQQAGKSMLEAASTLAASFAQGIKVESVLTDSGMKVIANGVNKINARDGQNWLGGG